MPVLSVHRGGLFRLGLVFLTWRTWRLAADFGRLASAHGAVKACIRMPLLKQSLEFGHYFDSGSSLEAGFDWLKT